MSSKTGPKFVQYFDDVLNALRELGGSGRPGEIIDHLSAIIEIDESEMELLSDGKPRFNKNINWARFYLAKVGLIDGSKRGVWSLTEEGLKTHLSHEDALHIFEYVQNEVKSNEPTISEDYESTDVEADELFDSTDHRKVVFKLLTEMPPAGFERLCQRLLRESGFEQVVVTGRSGDGGIDGQGILRINHFISFQVCFQCKRYKGTVGAPVVRDFRGSIMGRADKGIIMTTGVFSSDARKEATRDGATPIELVDGDQIIEMLEDLELGLVKKKTITIYEINPQFFDEFGE
jgi:restriction system protein